MGETRTGLHLGIELGGTSCKVAVYRETGNASAPLEQVIVKKDIETSQSDANITINEIIAQGKRIL